MSAMKQVLFVNVCEFADSLRSRFMRRAESLKSPPQR